jgi:hypothetical protein
MAKSKVIGVRLDEDLATAVEAAAVEDGRSISGWIANVCRIALSEASGGLAVKSVYVMSLSSDMCKIGFSANPQHRATMLRGSFDKSAKVFKAWKRPEGDHYDIERVAQELLAEYLPDFKDGYDKECFDCTPQVACAAVVRAIKIIEAMPDKKGKSKYYRWKKENG